MIQGIMIQMFIGSEYEGGIAEFNRDFYTHLTDDNRYILAPVGDKVLPEKFKEKLEELASGMNFTPIYAETCNFKGMEHDEATDYYNEALRKKIEKFNGRLMINTTRALLDIIAPGIKMDSDEGRELLSEMVDFDHVPNVRIQFDDETHFRVPDGTEGNTLNKVLGKVSVMESSKPQRDTVISDDDILNLKIALGSAETIEEFLGLV